MFDNAKEFLLSEDRGVSPVIGVILMVAITVILAAVIATFVMNMGPSETTQPNVQWEWNFDESGPTVTLSHTGGDAATSANFDIEIANTSSSDGTYNLESDLSASSEMSASDSITLDGSTTGITQSELSNGEFTLIWNNPSNDQTQEVDTFEP